MSGLEQTWRWYGPDDPVTLQHIRQAGATGIVTALHQIEIGAVWQLKDIIARRKVVEEAGLTWSVCESIPVHESIKTGLPPHQCKIFTDNYIESVENLGSAGVDILCYNFMPILDWTRTNLHFNQKDSSQALRFDFVDFSAFDLFILERQDAARDYTQLELENAKERFDSMSASFRDSLTSTIICGLPGRTSNSYSLPQFRDALNSYNGVTDQMVRDNLHKFIQKVAPKAEAAGVIMAIHPDDPPRKLLGLPRVVSTTDDIRQLLVSSSSSSNGLTLCVGSFGSREDNDVVKMAEEFANNTHFVHLRNVTKTADGGFTESNHLEGDVDMFKVLTILLKEQKRRSDGNNKSNYVRLPMRPDHGHAMLDDLDVKKVTNPGYTAIGRLRGLAELRGLQMGILRAGTYLGTQTGNGIFTTKRKFFV